MQACLALKQFQYILNVTEYVNENYLRVKEKFLRAIDYVEDINVGEPPTTDSTSRHKRNSENPFDIRVTLEETKYLTQYAMIPIEIKGLYLSLPQLELL